MNVCVDTLIYSGTPLERTQQERKPSNNGINMKVPNFFSLFLWFEPPNRTDPSIREIWGITDCPTGPSVIFSFWMANKKVTTYKRVTASFVTLSLLTVPSSVTALLSFPALWSKFKINSSCELREVTIGRFVHLRIDFCLYRKNSDYGLHSFFFIRTEFIRTSTWDLLRI